MPTMTLHHKTVGSLPLPKTGRTRYWDDEKPGLHVLVTAAGARLYKVRYERDARTKIDYRIGPVEDVALTDARKSAGIIIKQAEKAATGEVQDPQRKKVARLDRTNTFEGLANDCMDSLSLKPNTERQWRGMVKNHIVPKFGKLKPQEIERKAIRAFVEGLGKTRPVLAARVFEVTRRIFSWAVENEDDTGVKASPFVGLRKPEKVQAADSNERDRTLSRAEIHAIFAALGNDRFKLNGFDKYIRLLFETAVRREEMLKASWKEVDLNAKFFTIQTLRYKSKKPHQVPLTTAAVDAFKALQNHDALRAHLVALKDRARGATGDERAVLVDEIKAVEDRLGALAKSVHVFPGPDAKKPRSSPQRAFEDLRRRVGFEDWTLHDIRRTVANELDRLGTAPHVKEAILGHAPDKLTRTYSKHVPLLEMTKALHTWSKELDSIIVTPPSVHAFPREAATA